MLIPWKLRSIERGFGGKKREFEEKIRTNLQVLGKFKQISRCLEKKGKEKKVDSRFKRLKGKKYIRHLTVAGLSQRGKNEQRKVRTTKKRVHFVYWSLYLEKEKPRRKKWKESMVGIMEGMEEISWGKRKQRGLVKRMW